MPRDCRGLAAGTALVALIALRQAASAQGQAPARELSFDLGGGVRMEFALIPAGSFVMGDANGAYDEKPARKVTFAKPFYAGKYEVTQAQWEAVLGDNPSRFRDPRSPVETVSWDDCQRFVKALSGKLEGLNVRLPTEAEWEYACRAGTTTQFSFGDDDAKVDEYAWYHGNSGNRPHPVGQKKPNAWGIYDMHGNMWEWCRDWYGVYRAVEQADPTGPAEGGTRVLRGGCFSNFTRYVRCAYRRTYAARFRDDGIGFRLVLIPVAEREPPANSPPRREGGGNGS